jgi:hypothetical protein
VNDFETPEWAQDAVSETPNDRLVEVSVDEPTYAPDSIVIVDHIVPYDATKPHIFVPIPDRPDLYPHTEKCVCGRRMFREHLDNGSLWRTDAWLGHLQCPHQLGFGKCALCEVRKTK